MASRWHNGRLAELRFRCASNCRAGDDTKALAVTESVPPVLSGCEAISDSQSRAGRRDPTSLAGRREVLDGHLSHDRTRRRHICGRPLLEGRAEQERCTSHEAALVGAREHGRPLAQRSPSGSRGTRSGVTPVLRFDVADAAARHPRGAYYRLEQPRPPAAGPRRRPPRVRPLPRASRRFGDQAQDARIGRSSCVWAARRQTFASPWPSSREVAELAHDRRSSYASAGGLGRRHASMPEGAAVKTAKLRQCRPHIAVANGTTEHGLVAWHSHLQCVMTRRSGY